jgi:predicted proteasome-type protease
MTYCVGLLLDAGLVMRPDTRTNAGVDNISVFLRQRWSESLRETYRALPRPDWLD